MDAMPTPDQLNLGLLLVRLVVGPVLAFHGYAKIFRGGRLEGTARWFDSIGMRPGHVHARLAAGSELLTGTCLTLGLLTPFAGLGLVGLVVSNGWEYNVVLAAIAAALGLIGPGEWSLDEAIGLDLNGPAGLLISLGGGLAAATLLLATTHRPPVESDAEAA
jgi:putative oxidoreductase